MPSVVEVVVGGLAIVVDYGGILPSVVIVVSIVGVGW